MSFLLRRLITAKSTSLANARNFAFMGCLVDGGAKAKCVGPRPCTVSEHRTSNLASNSSAQINDGTLTESQSEVDVLYKRLEVEVRGHDPAVLKSYEWFASNAATHLGINLSRSWVPEVHKLRRKALKSAFAHGKHIVQYEFRTYFRVLEFKHLTGSTADTYLEYIQRNLPEGVAMKVTRERIEQMPAHIRPPASNK